LSLISPFSEGEGVGDEVIRRIFFGELLFETASALSVYKFNRLILYRKISV